MDWKIRAFDLALAPLAAGAAIPMRLVHRMSSERIPLTFGVLRRMGVFPIRRDYYEPLFDFSGLSTDNPPRALPGIGLALDPQAELLAQFDGAELLRGVAVKPTGYRVVERNTPVWRGNIDYATGADIGPK